MNEEETALIEDGKRFRWLIENQRHNLHEVPDLCYFDDDWGAIRPLNASEEEVRSKIDAAKSDN